MCNGFLQILQKYWGKSVVNLSYSNGVHCQRCLWQNACRVCMLQVNLGGGVILSNTTLQKQAHIQVLALWGPLSLSYCHHVQIDGF
ncbi:hypothetical protein FKM82_001975 [Ascaphus truei]